MFFGYGLFSGALLGRSGAFWPASLISIVLLFSFFDGGQGLRRMLTGSWHGIPIVILLALVGGLLFYLDQRLDASSHAAAGEELQRSAQEFELANRPGAWREHYGLTENAADTMGAIASGRGQRCVWRASYSDACDKLAAEAASQRSAAEQQRYIDDFRNSRS